MGEDVVHVVVKKTWTLIGALLSYAMVREMLPL